MHNEKMRLRDYKKITTVVILMSFWTTFPVFGTPPMEPTPISELEEMRFYSDSEIELLIEDLTIAAQEAIEKAAGEAARAAALASLEREAAALAEVNQWKLKYGNEKKAMLKKAVITGALCFVSGFAIGAGSFSIFGGR
jgi:hypothetical protein